MKTRRLRVTRTIVYEGDEGWVRGCMERRVTRLDVELGGKAPRRSITETLIAEEPIDDEEETTG